MARIVFYCNDTNENIEAMEYYRQDIEGLRALGHEVVVCNRYRDIPWRFDLLFVWWWTFAFIPVLFARLTGRKALITGTFNFRFANAGGGVDYFGRPAWQRLLIGLSAELASANVFVGSKEFAAVPAYFGLTTAHYAPHSVGDAYFTVRERQVPRTLLLNLAWSGVDNLRRKGVWTILEAAALLKQRGRAFDLVLAGKRGEGFDALQHKIGELGLGDCVQAVGEVTFEEKLELFARTRLYLQPSFYEGFGLATAEAMAAGCCVITTDVGEVSAVVGDCGMYVEPGDSAALADAIENLLSNQALIDQLNACAADRMQRLFSFERKKANLASILSQLSVRAPEFSN